MDLHGSMFWPKILPVVHKMKRSFQDVLDELETQESLTVTLERLMDEDDFPG